MAAPELRQAARLIAETADHARAYRLPHLHISRVSDRESVLSVWSFRGDGADGRDTVTMGVTTSVYLPDDVYRRWKASGQPLSQIVRWGTEYWRSCIEGAAPEPLAEAVERFTRDVWALAREGVITGPPEDDPFPPRKPLT